MKKIAMIIRTDSLDRDDRIRKEILSIQRLNPSISFYIYAMLDDNIDKEGITSYGIPYRSIFLPSRAKYQQGKYAKYKAYEFYKIIKPYLNQYDAVWCGDYHTAIIAMFCKIKPIIWDLHELPMMLLGNPIKHIILKYIFRRCKIILHANNARIKYLQEQGVILNPEKHFAVRNYPNFDDIDKEFDSKYHSFIQWKGDRECVYLQGLGNQSRAPFETISAVLYYPSLCAVVVGPFQEEVKKHLIEEYGEELLYKRVLFQGKINQLKIPQYIKQCSFSLIFYKNVQANNYYCEANRLYQTIQLGLPVVVGCNPPMKELIDKYHFGVCINNDGSDIQSIIRGIDKMKDNIEDIRRFNAMYRDQLQWSSQEPILMDVVNILFS